MSNSNNRFTAEIDVFDVDAGGMTRKRLHVRDVLQQLAFGRNITEMVKHFGVPRQSIEYMIMLIPDWAKYLEYEDEEITVEADDDGSENSTEKVLSD